MKIERLDRKSSPRSRKQAKVLSTDRFLRVQKKFGKMKNKKYRLMELVKRFRFRERNKFLYMKLNSYELLK